MPSRVPPPRGAWRSWRAASGAGRLWSIRQGPRLEAVCSHGLKYPLTVLTILTLHASTVVRVGQVNQAKVAVSCRSFTTSKLTTTCRQAMQLTSIMSAGSIRMCCSFAALRRAPGNMTIMSRAFSRLHATLSGPTPQVALDAHAIAAGLQFALAGIGRHWLCVGTRTVVSAPCAKRDGQGGRTPPAARGRSVLACQLVLVHAVAA